jgi:hypothetical protein
VPLRRGLPRELPPRDPLTRARLEEVGGRARPITLARERVLPVGGALRELLPGGALRRGATVAIEGVSGTGATSLAFTLAAAATDTGEWAGAVDLDDTFGGEAAAANGVALERFAVVRHVSLDRWATVVAVLLDGVALVVAEVPRGVRAGDARRLVARARERGAVLVTLPSTKARWTFDTTLRMRADGGEWPGLQAGGGLLEDRRLRVLVEGRGEAARTRSAVLARAG